VSATDPHQVFHRTIEAVWRIESARVIAGLTRLTCDLDLAEDLAQEALVAAPSETPIEHARPPPWSIRNSYRVCSRYQSRTTAAWSLGRLLPWIDVTKAKKSGKDSNSDLTVLHSRKKRGLRSVRSNDGSINSHIFFGILRR